MSTSKIDFSNRVRALRDRMGWTQAMLAEKLGISGNYVHMWESGKRVPGAAMLTVFSQFEDRALTQEALNVRAARSTQEAPPQISPQRARALGYKVNFAPKELVGFREVPVISWATAGSSEFSSFEELPKDWQDTLPIKVRENCFALTLRGDSMEPEFREGNIVVVVPGQVKEGDFVVAKLRDDSVTFKIYHRPAENRVKLISTNPLYPPRDYYESDFQWIWPVWQAFKNLKQ